MLTYEKVIEILNRESEKYWYKVLLGQNLRRCVACGQEGSIHLMTKNDRSHLGMLCQRCIDFPQVSRADYTIQKLEQEEVDKIVFLWNCLN